MILTVVFASLVCACGAGQTRGLGVGECSTAQSSWTAPQVRQCCELLGEDNSAIINLLSNIEEKHGDLHLDSDLPSLYTYKAVALFEMNRLHEAGEALNEAVRFNPADARAWQNLAEIRLRVPTAGDKDEALDTWETLTGKVNIAKKYERILWKDMEIHTKENDNAFLACLHHQDKEHCEDGAMSSAVDMTELNGTAKARVQEYFTRNFTSGLTELQDLTQLHASTPRKYPRDHLVIGFVLAVIDSGPVNLLTQSLLRRLDRRRCTVVGFVLSNQTVVVYEWTGTMLRSFDEIVSLDGLSHLEGATVIAQHKVDVLIDMNGFNYVTGVHTMKYRPCPVQINFLGDPVSASLSFMDYYIGDVSANPPDITAAHFSEKLALLGTSYLANSHLESTPDVLMRPRELKQDLPLVTVQSHLRKVGGVTCKSCELKEPILFGTFHTHSKFDPTIFHVWTNILRRVPASALVFASTPSNLNVMRNLVREAGMQGISEHRLMFLVRTVWNAHVHHKTAIDMYLDTVRKNGHTTTVDAAWAGLPTVALGGERTAGKRSAESVLHSTAENSHGVVFSLKEYEDLAVGLTATRRGRRRLASWRQYTDRARVQGNMFDPLYYSDKFLQLLQSMREVKSIVGNTEPLYNVFQATED